MGNNTQNNGSEKNGSREISQAGYMDRCTLKCIDCVLVFDDFDFPMWRSISASLPRPCPYQIQLPQDAAGFLVVCLVGGPVLGS